MMKLSSHSKVRLKERTDGLTYKQRKALFRLALHNGKSPGSIKDDEKLKQFLMSKQRYNSKVKLYIGMADYKAALEKDKQNVWYGTDEIKRQLNLNKQYENILGEIHFRYKLVNDFDELRNLYVN